MPLVPATKTVQNVIDRAQRQFGDESGAQITQSDIIAWINSGQNEINRQNRINKLTATMPTVAGTNQYTFPAVPILSIEYLFYNGMPLEYMGFNEAQQYIVKDDPTFSASGAPQFWYEYGVTLYVYPNPDTVGTLQLNYVGMFADVDAPTDTLSIPDAYYDTLLQYVLQQAYEQDDDWTGSSQKAGQVAASLGSLAEDRSGYERGQYKTITILDEDC